uniref:Uncharacterized protein n=2 Tax=Oryza TaxID=4527 RepID=A0A0E0NKM1_ORYRU
MAAKHHPLASPILTLTTTLLSLSNNQRFDGRAGGEAGAGAAAVHERRGPHRGGLHPVPGAQRRRDGGAGDHVAEGARHDVPQGRVGARRVHGRGRPPRGARGGRRPRRHRDVPRLLVLQEPPLRHHLRGLHVPSPRHRRAPPVARDVLPQAHLGHGAAGDGWMPARLDA